MDSCVSEEKTHPQNPRMGHPLVIWFLLADYRLLITDVYCCGGGWSELAGGACCGSEDTLDGGRVELFLGK